MYEIRYHLLHLPSSDRVSLLISRCFIKTYCPSVFFGRVEEIIFTDGKKLSIYSSVCRSFQKKVMSHNAKYDSEGGGGKLV